MKTVYLLRHAKSGWVDPDIEDFDRSLEERGQKNAAQIGQYLSTNKINPDIILCSTAARALETLNYLKPNLPNDQPISMLGALYLASPETILSFISQLDTRLNSVLVIAHNPGLHELSLMLKGQRISTESANFDRLMKKFPTGALATFECETNSWNRLVRSESNLTELVYPVDLPEFTNS